MKNTPVHEYLKGINLVQTKPRKRSIIADGKIRSFEFPWTSIGFDQHLGVVRGYWHPRPWKNLQDAARLVRLFPDPFHTEDNMGKICVGDRAIFMINAVTVTPADAFWMTDFADLGMALFDNYPLDYAESNTIIPSQADFDHILNNTFYYGTFGKKPRWDRPYLDDILYWRHRHFGDE